MVSPDPTNPPGANRPAPRRCGLLRWLAQTFTYPHAKQQASADVQRLLHAITDRPLEHLIELRVEPERRLRDVPRARNAAAVREDEIHIYGAHAHWTQTRSNEERS
jgi:hypothetical protein